MTEVGLIIYKLFELSPAFTWFVYLMETAGVLHVKGGK